MVKYDFTVRDRITGEEYHQIRNSAESKLMSIQGFIDLGIQEFEKLFDPYKLDIVECSIINVYHAEGWSY
jgi:threonyl-tRNA synthetase